MTDLTPQQRGLVEAMRIHRREQPKRWRELVDAIPDNDERKAADDYLGGIVARMRVLAALKKTVV